MRTPRSAYALLLLAVTVLAASKADYTSVKRKFQQIEKHQVKPGSRVPVTAAELNAYVTAELPKVAPPGIRRPSVVLEANDSATGRALIDFVKLRSAQGKPPNWFLQALLEGEHELAVTANIQSAAGMATVDLRKVDIDGIPISGSALDFLIRNYLVPNYPDAKIGKPFELKYEIERIEVSPGVAYVVMK